MQPLTYSQSFYQLKQQLQSLYDEQEASAIAHEVLTRITGADKLKRLMEKDTQLTAGQQEQYNTMAGELVTGKPTQYVLGYAWFMGREYKVNEHVLIPRPETEELVQWVTDEHRNDTSVNILDVGTGSGCIPVSLKLAMPHATIISCDISAEALMVAKENAARLKADIAFCQLDFLNSEAWQQLNIYDVIISNPPYIPNSEQANMHINVTKYEPHLALFVPDDDPLLFYRGIAIFGKIHLQKNGAIYCELEASHGEQTKALFESLGYTAVQLRKDMHGNMRMLKAML